MIELVKSLNPVGLGIIVAIMVILIASVICAISIRIKYKKLCGDILNNNNRESMLFKYEVNNKIIEDYKSAVGLNIKEINTIAILDKNMSTKLHGTLLQERFVSKSASLMIILGLIGTFFGLTLSITELVSLLNQTGEAVISDVNTITDGLLNSISGMSVAFLTSLFGITASIIINLMTIAFGISESRDEYTAIVEEFLDNYVGRKSVDYDDVNLDGKTPIEAAFETLSNDLTESIKEVTSTLSYRLTVASNNMTETAESIQGSMDRFDESIKEFSSNTRDFSEFNHHLKTNIERMSVSFDDLSEGIKSNNKVLTKEIDKLVSEVKAD